MFSFILISIVCGLLGALLHEIAHWTVWKLTGRNPQLDWWNLNVYPRAGDIDITPGDRIAALAPYILALGLLPAVINSGYIPFAIGLLFLVQYPSSADINAALGRGQWNIQPR